MLVFSASGACSGHGGVSCAAGSDSDGSVICNDGWRKSSVSYSSMKMCGEIIEFPYIPEAIPEVIVPKIIQPVQQKVIPSVKTTQPKPTKSAPIKEVKKIPVGKSQSLVDPKIETGSSSPINNLVSEQPKPMKKMGLFSRLLNFFK